MKKTIALPPKKTTPNSLYFQHILCSLSLCHWFSMGMGHLPQMRLWKFVGTFLVVTVSITS